jgi:site-specific DNA recombinase
MQGQYNHDDAYYRCRYPQELVGRLGEIVATLRNADPRDKAEVYQHLGLYLRFDPGRNRVRAEARIGSTRGGRFVSEGGLEPPRP